MGLQWVCAKIYGFTYQNSSSFTDYVTSSYFKSRIHLSITLSQTRYKYWMVLLFASIFIAFVKIGMIYIKQSSYRGEIYKYEIRNISLEHFFAAKEKSQCVEGCLKLCLIDELYFKWKLKYNKLYQSI